MAEAEEVMVDARVITWGKRAGDGGAETRGEPFVAPSETEATQAVASIGDTLSHRGAARGYEDAVEFDDEDAQYETLSLSQVDPHDKVKRSELIPRSSMVVEEDP
mmetsp:Transcript_19256/g.37198  ORF Transcript_19256/g.37198 Transcript_19256/m.37198 type:complete len:105 (+) Transcript_19256:273-587(+)